MAARELLERVALFRVRGFCIRDGKTVLGVYTKGLGNDGLDISTYRLWQPQVADPALGAYRRRPIKRTSVR